MQIPQNAPMSVTPGPAVFKTWLKRALFELEVNPVELGRRADVGTNTIGTFLREDRDIRLGVASKIHAAALAIAAEKSIALTPIDGGRANA